MHSLPVPELVVTVPAGCSTAKDDNQWKLSTHSLLTFITEFLSAVVKMSQHYAWLFHDFPWFSMTFAVLHDYPGLEYGLLKFHDFPGPVVTLYVAGSLSWCSANSSKVQKEICTNIFLSGISLYLKKLLMLVNMSIIRQYYTLCEKTAPMSIL